MREALWLQTSHKLLRPAVSMLATAGVSLAVVTVVSFLVARKFGGQNRRKRQAVFSVMSFIGVLYIPFYIYLNASGK